MNNNVKIVNSALKYYGIPELIDGKLNPTIDTMLDQMRESSNNENWAWCSAFVNWILYCNNIKGSDSLAARSFLKVGTKVNEPILGDIVVFWRESKESWKGHVGVYIRSVGGDIYVLGGNQGNTVCIRKYSASKLLGYRRV